MIAEAALDEGARRMGLGASDADVVRAISEDPNFKGLDGKFDADRFNALIRQFGYNEQRYIAEQRRVSLRRQLSGTVANGAEPSKTQLEALIRFQNEQRSVEYVNLTEAQAGTIDPPSPEALAAYFEDRKALFRAPEYRKIAMLTLTPDEIAKSITVSDEDAKKIFELRRERCTRLPNASELHQIAFPNREEAKAAREKIAAGTSFEDIAKERKLTPSDIDLGTITKAAIGDPPGDRRCLPSRWPPDTVQRAREGALVAALMKVTQDRARRQSELRKPRGCH